MLKLSKHSTLLFNEQKSCASFYSQLKSTERVKAISSLRERVGSGRECVGLMVQSLLHEVEQHGADNQPDELLNLIKAFKLDIVNYFPKQQKKLLHEAWELVRKVECRVPREPILFSTALDAFNFQRAQLDVQQFIRDVDSNCGGQNATILEKLLVYHCNNKDIENALGCLETTGVKEPITLNEHVAASLVYCFCSRGEYDEAAGIISALEERKVQHGQSIYRAQVLGSAANGDIDRLKELIQIYAPGDQVMLQALVELSEVAPEHLDVVLDRILPRDVMDLAASCRRPIKHLVELGQFEGAEKLLMKTVQLSENSTDNEPVICISPSVIVLTELLKHQTSPDQLIQKIYSLQVIDNKMVERSTVLMFDHCMEEPGRLEICSTVTKALLQENHEAVAGSQNLISQNVARRIKAAETEDEVFNILRTTANLGLSLTARKVWFTALKHLIPPNQEYTNETLIQRIKFVRSSLDCMLDQSSSLYSDSIIWSHILKYLIEYKSSSFFKAAAQIVKESGETPGLDRWHNKLAENLIHSKDVESFVDILKVVHMNLKTGGEEEKKKMEENFIQVSHQLNIAITIAERKKEETDNLLEDVFDRLWANNIPLPSQVKSFLVDSPGVSEMLSEIASNLPETAISRPAMNKHFRRGPGSQRNREQNTRQRAMT